MCVLFFFFNPLILCGLYPIRVMGAAEVCPRGRHANAGYIRDRKTKVSSQTNAHVFGLWEETPD